LRSLDNWNSQRKYPIDRYRCPIHCIPFEKAGARAQGHLFPFRGKQRKPTPQQAFRALERIAFDESHSVLINVRPDVYLVAYQDRTTNRESFHHGYAEVLLVRGQDKCFCSPDRAPFKIAANETGPVYTPFYSELFSQLLKLGPHLGLVGTCDNKIHIRHRRGYPGKCLKEQVTTLLLVNTPEEQEIAAIAQLRVTKIEGLDLVSGIELALRWIGPALGVDPMTGRLASSLLGIIDSIWNDDAVPFAGTEAGNGQISFRLRRKEDGASPMENCVLERPINQFLDVFERILPVKPRIEAAVNKYPVGFVCPARGQVNGDSRKGPDSVHYDPVEARGIDF
jgi:hypothetical protein